jgi:hypothetical protein
MGFGFNLGMIFIILPVTILLFLTGVITKKTSFLKAIGCIWIPIVCLIGLSLITNLFPDNVLEKEDYYGEYVIDRNFFKGKQADWQYNHFRMEITEDDSIFLYTLENEKIVSINRGTISTVKPYNSERLVLKMNKPNHHITETNPTTYREPWWNFYLVFKSKKFHNMYFRKGTWEKLVIE